MPTTQTYLAWNAGPTGWQSIRELKLITVFNAREFKTREKLKCSLSIQLLKFRNWGQLLIPRKLITGRIMRLNNFHVIATVVSLAFLTGAVTVPAIASSKPGLESQEPNFTTHLTRRFTADPSFANSSQTYPTRAAPPHSMRTAQHTDISLSSSVVVNPEFDRFVRRRPYVIHTYRNNDHGRLLSLARRQMTYMEMKRAITEILNRNR